ncbi:MAG: DHH family phosphoesterase [Promethearchaeota archaeon]
MVFKIPLKDFLEDINERKDYFLNSINFKTNTSDEHQKNKRDLKENGDLTLLDDDKNKISYFKKNVHIYSHLDSDGLTAAAILTLSLKRAKISYQLSILTQLDVEHIKSIKEEIKNYNRFIIFSDFGTGQIDFLKKELGSENYLILDHHQPVNMKETPEIFHVNPYYYGISGENEISAAGVCYLFAKTLNPRNIDLSSLAIIGALGDMQNQGEKGEFLGTNRSILDDAIKSGKISIEKDLSISRHQPLHIALAYSLPEKIPSISDDEEKCKLFFESIQIKIKNEWNEQRTLLNLSKGEKKTLIKALINEGYEKNNKSKDFARKLIKNYFILSNFEPVSDAKELSKLLNACGRLGAPSLGIACLMGDKEALLKAIDKNKTFKKKLTNAINLANKSIRNYKNINTFYNSEINEKIIGTVCSILLHSREELKLKPMIAFADSDHHFLKVSARADRNLIKKGLNLGKILREVCQKMDIKNPAGGHPPAAGAKIPSMNLKIFIEEVDNAIGEQLN